MTAENIYNAITAGRIGVNNADLVVLRDVDVVVVGVLRPVALD